MFDVPELQFTSDAWGAATGDRGIDCGYVLPVEGCTTVEVTRDGVVVAEIAPGRDGTPVLTVLPSSSAFAVPLTWIAELVPYRDRKWRSDRAYDASADPADQ